MSEVVIILGYEERFYTKKIIVLVQTIFRKW